MTPNSNALTTSFPELLTDTRAPNPSQRLAAPLVASRQLAAGFSGLTPAREAKLRQAAGEFESMLLSSFWKSMKASFAADGEDSSDPAHESLEDWGIQAMSTAVGKAGGLGLGKMILKRLETIDAAATGRSVDLGKLFAAQADKAQ